MVNAWRRHSGSVADLVMVILKDTHAREQLEKKRGEKARQKLDCLSIFHEQVTRWAPKSIYNLFDSLDRQMRPRQAKNDDAVQLMTIHASKGLEWDAVFVLGVEEGTLPYQVAVDEGNLAEERRLAYVAITRARRYLMLSHCHERASFGAKKSVTPSRFLTEMMKPHTPPETKG
jgi:superfamily I DNA/RNA helicase